MRTLRTLSLVAIPLAGALLALPASGAGRRDVRVTRDPSNTPLTTYSGYTARVGSPSEFRITEVERTGNRGTGTILVIVEVSLYTSVSAALAAYSSDLALGAGYTVATYTTSGGTPASLRSYIQSQASGLVGVLLIGDLPIPWFEIDYEFDGPDEDTLDDEYTNFPCDLFYMDLDGSWQDLKSTAPFLAGVYDSHTNGSGDTAPEIWVGRLTTSTLTLGGATEAGLVNTYLTKNHNFRLGNLSPIERMLLYVDDDWVDTAQSCDSAAALSYSSRVLVQDKAVTCRNDYRDIRLSASYEFMHVMLHATPTLHYFKVNDLWEMDGGNYATVTSTDIQARDPAAIFYSLYTCSSCRYVETDYIGGWYIFVPTNGLGVVGTTKVGGMWGYASFYGALGAGQSLGSALRDWFAAQAPYDQADVRWYYGMTLLGDGALALRPHVSDGDPARHELAVAQNTQVTLSFDRPMDSTTFDSGSVSVCGSQSGPHAGTYNYDGNLRRLRFTSSAEFQDGEETTVNLSHQVRSADGIPAAADFRLFTAAIGNPTPGTFVSGGTTTVKDLIYLHSGDWNGDGWPDLVGGHAMNLADPDSIYVLLNDGAGGFLPVQAYAGGRQLMGIASADLDGDGDLDLAFSWAETCGAIGVYMNQGNGTFTGPACYTAYSAAGGKILAGDWDGDGDIDLATLSGWPNGYVNIYSNDGSGVFTLSYFSVGMTQAQQFLHVSTDVDGDGDLDLVGLGRGGWSLWSDSLSVYRNDGRGRFTRSRPAMVPFNPNDLVANDFDGDGDVDFVVTADGDTSKSVMFLRNAGDGTISERVTLDHGGNTNHPTSGDWDGDGDIDLAYIYPLVHPNYAIRIRLNNGTGSFSPPVDNSVVTPGVSVAADFDRDHDLDLAVANGNLYRLDNDGGADAIPPARVYDLAGSASKRAVGSIRWTAPGDDGSVGRATLYDLRYSTTPVAADSAAWWSAARLATGEPLPAPAGVPDSCEIAGLSPDSTYYLVLCTRDDASNWSGYSNVYQMAAASADVSDPALAGAGFRLEAVAPNPCGVATLIHFRLGEAMVGAARVRLTLFDVQGREVRRLVDRTSCPAGPHAVLWDLRSDAGLPVPSGQYFCRLESGSLRRTQRILCIR
jgi:hypothetical protein